MALRLANKINRQVVKNVCRSLSAKRETEIEPVIQKAEDVTIVVETPPATTLPLNGANIPTQYEVCRPRTTLISPFPHSVQNETDVAKKTVALQHLQPSMLPEYYKPPVEINAACMYFDPITETDRQATTKYRQFEQSKTCTNVTLPLRGPKLASPFPDPVKVMQSHTTTDQEKAEQMLAESKVMKGHVDKNKQNNRQPSIRSLPPQRTFSTSNQRSIKNDPGSGKKKKKVCPHVKVQGCRPVKSIKCNKTHRERPVCLKKPPPYPSYSETCHEEPYNKPSECKTCPYKADEHPYFKPTKQDFHTATKNLIKQKDECSKPPGDDKKPCGWVKEDKNKPNDKQPQEKKPQPKKKAMINLADNSFPHKIDEPEQSLAINLKSKNFSFPTPKAKEYEEQKKAKETKNSPTSTKTKQLSSVALSREMGEWLSQLQPEDILSSSGGLQVSDTEPKEKGKCKKFPFKNCTFNIVTERKERPVYRKCPPKPKRKLIQDCPADQIQDKPKRSTSVNNVLTYFMSDDAEKPDQKSKKKCPRVNVDVCKEPHEYDDDPCKRKKTGKTQICPSDLLTKKPRPKKKTKSPMIPLAQIPRASRIDTAVKL